jgi:hypothetical protein
MASLGCMATEAETMAPRRGPWDAPHVVPVKLSFGVKGKTPTLHKSKINCAETPRFLEETQLFPLRSPVSPNLTAGAFCRPANRRPEEHHVVQKDAMVVALCN